MNDPLENTVNIQVDGVSLINFALQQNRIPAIRKIIISNPGESPLENAVLKIWSKPEITLPFEKVIQFIPAQSSFSLDEIGILLDADFLSSLTERITGVLQIELFQNGIIQASLTHEITALAFDEWQGTQYFPELLSAFVTPNHPELSKIIVRASDLLNKWTGDPAMNAYQSQSTNRVRLQAAAIYGALQELNFVYVVPPASFEITGQRIRLCHTVLDQHIGTCLDLSLLYASCLEAIGLHPLLVMQQGHIFAGLWLEDMTFPESIQDDASVISKRLPDDIGEITVVECTALTSGKSVSFEQAVRAASDTFLDPKSFEFVIDVSRARLSGIRPLPLRVKADGGWGIAYEKRDEQSLTEAPEALKPAVTVLNGTDTPSSRKMQWERKLLDLSLRNSLLSMHLTSRLIPILSASLIELEDALASGDDFAVMPRPDEWERRGGAAFTFDNIHDLGAYADLIHTEFKNKRLRSALSEGEHLRSIVELYRSAKVSLEENGANTLYLALGTLRWFESTVSEKPRYAPLVLLPIEIVRKSASKGFVIRLRDDDPQANITLLEMLKQDFGITISGLDPLPLDEHGIDLRSVFATLRRAVMNQPRWDVIESAFIGVFSFTQFVMWNDIRNRTDDLLKNKIVRSLMEGRLTWEASRMEIGDRVTEENVLLPIAADASQLFAIHAANQGQSFVLHGPPGTGKSQTITALIANALAQGKTVLFVAEKMAALAVVQKRLKSLGIDPFCLELHSNKSHKRDVLEQLRQATEVTRFTSALTYSQKAEQAQSARNELDSYALQLHKIRSSGINLFEMINRYEAVDLADNPVQFSKDYAAALGDGDLSRHEAILERLVAAGQAIGHPHNHPLRTIGRSTYAQSLRSELPELIKSYRQTLDQLDTAMINMVRVIGQSLPKSKIEWETRAQEAAELVLWQDFPKSWSKKIDLAAYLKGVRELAEHAQTADRLKSLILQHWSPDFLQLNGTDLDHEYQTINNQWFLPKFLKNHLLVKRLKPFSVDRNVSERLAMSLTQLKNYQMEKSQTDDLLRINGDELEQYNQGDHTDWVKLESNCTKALESARKLDALSGGPETRIQQASSGETGTAARMLVEEWGKVIAAEHQLDAAVSLLPDRLPDIDWINEQRQMCTDIASQPDSLKAWMAYRGAALESESIGLTPVNQAYEAGLDHRDVLPAYRRGIYRAMIITTVESEDILNSFSGPVFNKKIDQYLQIDTELAEITKHEIYCRLAAKIPDFTREAANSSELGVLQRAIRSNGRGVSIRHLFEQIPNLLPRLCPCMLMSPISAAQYLDPKRTPFDLIVFDEASQIPTCKAVGALARGKEAIIVGDPKQMPPTSFFMGNNVDEDNIESEDLESILDDCLALSFPETHLLWHYRSRHESLISFSNNQFYENKLLTFPSVNDRESKVSLVPVDGCFDRGKTRQNRAEAQAVVAEILRRFEDQSGRQQSIGVITFNISQQNLIDDLFTEACKANTELEAWAYETEEPLFIKNLENVQGDERDTILFSVGYGADKDGKVYMNFGPLNRDGGWRRLNVAVSRARCEMKVFSTLRPDQINLSKTSAKGVSSLKAFLEYAERGILPANENTTSEPKSGPDGIIDSICQALQEAGYHTACSIGHSKYRIDIGVVDPQNPESYVLGILLDGASYGQAKTTRDRELAQLKILDGLGWTIHRIWAMDWWDNRDQEIKAFLDKLNVLVQQPRPGISPGKKNTGNVGNPAKLEVPSNRIASLRKVYPEPGSAVSEAKAAVSELASLIRSSDKSIPIQTRYSASHYTAHQLVNPTLTADDFLQLNRTQLIFKAFKSVINAEAPISESLLTRRILQSFGIARAGSRIQSRTQSILALMNLQQTRQGELTFYWRDDQDPKNYPGFRITGDGNNTRDARDVPVQEVANALCAVLDEQIGLPEDDLIRETSKKLGYSRSGTNVTAMVKGGITAACQDGRIRQDTRGYYTLTTQ